MENILVAYDGSEGSEKALSKSIDLLKEGDRLVVLYVLPAAAIPEFFHFDEKESREKAQRTVEGIIAKLRRRGIKSAGLVREGDVANEIMTVGSKLGCSLIVVGSRGLSKIGTFALGSVAEKVARHASCPVLIVR